MVVICDFHSQGRGSIPRGGVFLSLLQGQTCNWHLIDFKYEYGNLKTL